jgi:hypothetical protein
MLTTDYLQSRDSLDDMDLYQLVADMEAGEDVLEPLLSAVPQFILDAYHTLVDQFNELSRSYGWLTETECEQLLSEGDAVWLTP